MFWRENIYGPATASFPSSKRRSKLLKEPINMQVWIICSKYRIEKTTPPPLSKASPSLPVAAVLQEPLRKTALPLRHLNPRPVARRRTPPPTPPILTQRRKRRTPMYTPPLDPQPLQPLQFPLQTQSIRPFLVELALRTSESELGLRVRGLQFVDGGEEAFYSVAGFVEVFGEELGAFVSALDLGLEIADCAVDVADVAGFGCARGLEGFELRGELCVMLATDG